MKLQFIGADHEVTGSCHYLQAGDSYMLVDYGMEQGVNRFENCPLPVPESQINFVFLTHAHIDHSGMLPLLYAHGFQAARFIQRKRPRTYAASCSGTAPTFSSRRRSGKAGRQNAMPESKWRSRCIRWRMRSAPSTVSYHARMGKNWK